MSRNEAAEVVELMRRLKTHNPDGYRAFVELIRVLAADRKATRTA